MFSISAFSFALSFLTFALGQNVVSLAPPAAVPSGASPILSPSFAGFGIEPSNLFSFTGGANPNQLSINLLQNLADYTGTPPYLRIGGNTQDNIIYDASWTDWSREANPKPVGQGAFPTDQFIVGPKFFTALNRFPKNTPITYGLNLAYQQPDYIDRMIAQVNAARKGLTNIDLARFEIGNEPDLYGANGFRTGPWTGATYVEQWLDRASAIWQQILEPNNMPSNVFEPGATASTIGTSFQIVDLVQDGVTAKANSSTKPYVAGFNQHDYYYYIGVSTYVLTFDLFTDLSTTVNQFAAWTDQLTQSYAAGYPYYLREMGVVGPIGYAGITDTFAASLWTLNFFLYAATLNISSVQMHMTDNSNASAWQSIPYPPYCPQPFVRPNYYAWPAMTQIIGKGCSTRIASLPIAKLPTAYNNRLNAYTSYQQGKLAAIILINTVVANVSTTPKGSITIDLSLPAFAGQTIYLSYLTAEGADAKHNAVWNGTSYEQSGNGLPTVTDGTVNSVKIAGDGSVSFTLRDSQAVVANIGSFVGTGEANDVACAALKAGFPDAESSGPTSTDAKSPSTSQSSAASSTTPRPTPSSLASWSRALSALFLGTSMTAILIQFM